MNEEVRVGEDVCKWLKSIQDEQYYDNFIKNGLDTLACSTLDDEALQVLGVTLLGHRKALLKASQQLRGILFYSRILFYSIKILLRFYSILFYSILFYSPSILFTFYSYSVIIWADN